MAGEIDQEQNDRLLRLELKVEEQSRMIDSSRDKIQSIFNLIHGDGSVGSKNLQSLIESMKADVRVILNEQKSLKLRLKDYPWIQKLAYGMTGLGIIYAVKVSINNVLN